MRYEEISYNTKKTMAKSLKKIMENKPFSKITVSEIIKDCNINRKTFYYHFEDIHSLLKWTFEEEAVEVVKNFDLYTDYKSAVKFAVDYIDKNRYMINCAYDSVGRDVMKGFFYSDFFEIIKKVIDDAEKNVGKSFDPGFKNFTAAFYTEAIAGMLINISKEKDSEKRHRLSEYLSQTIEKQFELIN